MVKNQMTSHCKECGERIRWARNDRGNWLPLAESSDPLGNHQFIGKKQVVRLVGVEKEMAQIRGEILFKHHAADCVARRPHQSGAMPPHVREQLRKQFGAEKKGGAR